MRTFRLVAACLLLGALLVDLARPLLDPLNGSIASGSPLGQTPLTVLYLPASVAGVSDSAPTDEGEADTALQASLVRNPGCETDSSGWYGYQSSLRRDTSAARSGSASCLVTFAGTGADYTIDDDPATVSRPPKGARYAASAWVRTTTAGNKPVLLNLRLSGGATAAIKVTSAAVALSSNWQKLSASITVDTADRQTLEIYIAQTNATAGNSFQVDDISLAQSITTVSPTATPTSTSPTPTSAPATPAPPAPPTATPSPAPTNTPVSSGMPSANTANAQTWAGQLLSPSSPWNVAPAGGIDPNSGQMLTSLAQALGTKGFDIALSEWTMPIWYADASTPRVWIGDKYGWWSGMTAPLPTQARPDPQGDRHLIVWDMPNQRLYEFWDFDLASRTAGFGITFDAQGSGYQTGLWQNSARAYGGSAAAGLIRYQEMVNGAINHALAMAYPLTRGKAYARGTGPGGTMGIASHSDNAGSADRNTSANIPEGARLRLKASFDVNARCGSNRACGIIARALKTYGAYVVDTSGAPVFYGEGLYGKQVSWTGLLSATDARAFRADDFEIMALPALTSAP